ncbi:MAG: deoxyribonuclease IV [Blastocatellia bacterium]|nr:deoxyribonuclease IV [Blastocatellia bacterium]
MPSTKKSRRIEAGPSSAAVARVPRLGVHAGIAGGLHRSIHEAREKGCLTWQIFSRNPRGWTAKPLSEEDIALFRAAREASGLDPCLIHSCYLINLAASAEEIRAKSIAAFRDEVERGLAIGANHLVLHPGSSRGTSPEQAIETCAAALRESVGHLAERMARNGFFILIENTAGQGEQIGRSFAQVGEILERCPDLPMGMCLDTAHSFAAGYDWRDETATEAAMTSLGQTVGFDRIKAVHFNDSKAAFNSRVDRHWHIGEGEIGAPGLARVLNHPELRDLPFILETPQDEQIDDRRNLAAARALASL